VEKSNSHRKGGEAFFSTGPGESVICLQEGWNLQKANRGRTVLPVRTRASDTDVKRITGNTRERREIMKVKSLQKQLMAAIAMVLVAAIALSSATYAWFVNNAQVTATNVNVQAATAYSLLISHEIGTNEAWGTTTALTALTNKLTPVSTTGEINDKAITLTAKDGDTAAVGIGDGTTVAVGDVRFTAGTKWENSYMTEFSEVSKDSKTADATDNDTSKYFYTEEVYMKAAQASKLFLNANGIKIVWTKSGDTTASTLSISEFMDLPVVTAAEGSTLTDAQKTYNENLASAKALIKTLRVGFTITKYTDGDTTKDVTSRNFFEYQLVDDYIESANAVNTTVGSNSSAEGLTKAVQASTGTVADISADSSTMSGKTIMDYAASGSETSMVLTADQTDKDKLADLAVNEVIKCDIYVWMEGCDYDTVAANINSFSGTGLTGLQFGFCLGE
jgi:hypothetical protein